MHFTASARTAWHSHSHGQTISVTEGVGLCQREGGRVEVIRPRDRVFFELNENHWHGAAPDRFIVHIAMQQNDDTGEGGQRRLRREGGREDRLSPLGAAAGAKALSNGATVIAFAWRERATPPDVEIATGNAAAPYTRRHGRGVCARRA
jgi:hypothetical protein